MHSGSVLAIVMVVVAVFLLVCVLASKFSAKSGVPALVLFLLIGMLAGSDGPGGIHFSDFAVAKTVGSVALAFILFAGGLETSWATLKPVLWRGLSLSMFGVLATCLLVGAFAHFVLGLPWMLGLLLGAVVSSTDAAAVFSVLKSTGLRLKHKVTPLLELESGTNDPVAVFLTLGVTQLILHPETSALSLIPKLLIEMPLGLAVGFLSGMGAVTLINRVRLAHDGLYSIITIAAVCFSFGGSELLHGNPFLAVYAAGVTMGSRNFLHRIALIQFHDAIAWITQIVMFVVLGLLVFPRQLVSVALPGLALSLFLIFVVRPVSVFIALAFAKTKARTKLFVAWAGLRGAVPIVLATFPALEQVPGSSTVFNLVFFIVLTSVLIQGTAMRVVAQKLNVAAAVREQPPSLREASHDDLLEVTLGKDALAVGKQVVELGLPPTALIVLLRRDHASYIPQGSTVLKQGDRILVATRRQDQDELRRRFE